VRKREGGQFAATGSHCALPHTPISIAAAYRSSQVFMLSLRIWLLVILVVAPLTPALLAGCSNYVIRGFHQSQKRRRERKADTVRNE